MSFNRVTGNNPRRPDPPKHPGRLVSLFGVPKPRSSSEATMTKPTRSNFKHPQQDLMQQGRGIRARQFDPAKPDLKRLSASAENDERYKYLLANGIVKRVEENDSIIYAELPQIPGILVVYRKPSDRNESPERLNLDKRELDHVPLLEGEERLRLLNFQHNQIPRIENLVSLPNLIFLDFYDNKIREIANLNTVPTLRVLMLGKNQIDKIKNLQGLSKLDVLDLHTNKLSKIEGLDHLAELRVLNLANNSIRYMENIQELSSLTEINLRKNNIEQIAEIDHLQKLQRAFLSNNNIKTYQQLAWLQKCQHLQELALDANPIQNHQDYFQWILNAIINLKLLDNQKITPELRIPTASTNEPPVEIEEPAPKATPPSQSKPPTPTVDHEKEKAKQKENDDKVTSEILSHIESEWYREIERIKEKKSTRKESANDCIVKSAHAVLEDETHLYAYGNAIEVLEKANDYPSVSNFEFKHLRFDFLSRNVCLINLRNFKLLTAVTLDSNNLTSFIQVSKFESLTQLRTINIYNNDVSQTILLRPYIVYRFPHLTTINEAAITDQDKDNARLQFQTFDKTLTKTLLSKSVENKKTNLDVASTFVNDIVIGYAVRGNEKRDAVNMMWDSMVYNTIKQSLKEATYGVNETILESLLNSPSIM